MSSLPPELWGLICEYLPLEDLLGSHGICHDVDGARRWELRCRFKRPDSIPDIRQAYILLARLCHHGKEEAVDLLTSHTAFDRETYFHRTEGITFKQDAPYYALYHCTIGKQWALYETIRHHPVCIEKTGYASLFCHDNVRAYALGVSCNRNDFEKTVEDPGPYEPFILGLWSGWRGSNDPRALKILAEEILSPRGICRYLKYQTFDFLLWKPHSTVHADEKTLEAHGFNGMEIVWGVSQTKHILISLYVRKACIQLHDHCRSYLSGELGNHFFHNKARHFANVPGGESMDDWEWWYDHEEAFLNHVSSMSETEKQ